MRNIMFVVLIIAAGCAQADYTPEQLEVRRQFVLDCVRDAMSDPKLKDGVVRGESRPGNTPSPRFSFQNVTQITRH